MSPSLVLISDLLARPESVETMSQVCADAKSSEVAVVLRDRELSWDLRSAAGRQLREVTRRTGQFFVVAEPLELALSLGADGIHLRSSGAASSTQARNAGLSWISRAHHDADALSDEQLLACTHLFVSPVCAGRKGREPLGLAGFSRRAGELKARHEKLGLYCLGGVDSANAAECLAAGADGVCVMGGLYREGEPAGLLRSLSIRRSGGSSSISHNLEIPRRGSTGGG